MKLREQLGQTQDLAQYQMLHEKIFRLLIFAKEKLELATFSIPVRMDNGHKRYDLLMFSFASIG